MLVPVSPGTWCCQEMKPLGDSLRCWCPGGFLGRAGEEAQGMLGVNFFPHQNWVYPGSNDAAALGSSQGPVGPQQHTHTIMCCEVFKRCLLKSAKITPLSKPAPPTMFPSMGGWEIRAVGQALGRGARVGRVRVSGAEATLSQCWDDFQKCSNHTLCWSIQCHKCAVPLTLKKKMLFSRLCDACDNCHISNVYIILLCTYFS